MGKQSQSLGLVHYQELNDSKPIVTIVPARAVEDAVEAAAAALPNADPEAPLSEPTIVAENQEPPDTAIPDTAIDDAFDIERHRWRS